MKKITTLSFAFLAIMVVGCTKKDALSNPEQQPAGLTTETADTEIDIQREVVVTTLAGNEAVYGYQDGQGANASFQWASDMGMDNEGNLLVRDGRYLRKVTPAGLVTTFTLTKADDTEIFIDVPSYAATDVNGDIFVSNGPNHSIRRIDAKGYVHPFVGGTQGYADGQGSSARFNGPSSKVFDEHGNLYVVDQYNYRIRKITPDGTVSTFAGNGGSSTVDGVGTAAYFDRPFAIAIDGKGNLYVTEPNAVRKITPDATVTTVVKSGAFINLQGIAVDKMGTVYVVDGGAAKNVKKVTPDGQIKVIAGTESTATFTYPYGIAIDAMGKVLYVTDNNTIKKITNF